MNGGAIALGHPLDKSNLHFLSQGGLIFDVLRCTGARQIVTGLNELRRRRGKVVMYEFGMGSPNIFVCRSSLRPCVLGQEWVRQVFFCGRSSRYVTVVLYKFTHATCLRLPFSSRPSLCCRAVVVFTFLFLLTILLRTSLVSPRGIPLYSISLPQWHPITL